MQQIKNVIPFLKHFPISSVHTLHKQFLFISLFHCISLKITPDNLIYLRLTHLTSLPRIWHFYLLFLPSRSYSLLSNLQFFYSSAHKFNLLENFIPFLFLLFVPPKPENLSVFPFLLLILPHSYVYDRVRRQGTGKPAAKENISMNSCKSEFMR